MSVKNEKELNRNNTTKKPAAKKSPPKGGKKLCSLKGLPDPSWSERQLVDGARYQWEEIQAAEKKAALHVFRLGAALILLKQPMKKQRRWGTFLKDLHISESTAWRAIEMFTRAKTEDKVASLTITEAYEQFGIAHFEIPADKDDGDDNAAEKGGKLKAAAKNAVAKNVKAKEPSPKDEQEDAAYEEIEVQGGNDSNDEGKQDADALSLDHRSTRKKQSDEYYTPDAATALLLPYLPKGEVIGEVAWGQGHIARYLQSHGYRVVGGPNKDFLTDSIEVHTFVTNPPFSRKNDFLRRAFELGKPFAFLLPADALVGLARYPLFVKHGIQLLIPDKRIQFISDLASAPNFNTFWFCWKLLPQDIIFAELPQNDKGGVK